eukprot:TRINITY_DN19082_c0_g1_i2.p2 TRINITY_DN19082_c0_g1~~TRINITY_DN19082_c0_g1_i2.p2  ORF type:complete len:173 (+),score=20.60 TRINITY_DN19082_c0_g1_i2:450-968(+)
MLLKNALLGKNAKIQTKTILIATISPCSCDVEHSVNTLKNALLMYSSSDLEKDVEIDKFFVDLSDGRVFHENQQDLMEQSLPNKRTHHPRDWTPEMVQNWLQDLKDGRFVGTVKQNICGKQMMTWGVAHFRNACNENEKLGKQLFDLFQKEKIKATKAKEVRAQRKAMCQNR